MHLPTVPPAPTGFRSGFVTVLGRPNVGKSTLVNQIIGEKVAITSPTAQTTRNRLRGILTRPEAQLILVDTPGIHKPHHKLGQVLVHNARTSFSSADGVLLIVDGSVPAGTGDQFVADSLRDIQVPHWLVLNKVDLRREKFATDIRASYDRLLPKALPFEVSALSGDGVDTLLTSVLSHLPEGPYYYPPDLFTDQPERFIMGELIREQILRATREEVPHSVAVIIERVEEGEHLTRVLATILVERDTQKAILIGKQGQMLKHIGTESRLAMQKLLSGKVYLEVFIKVRTRWRQSESMLRELGYRRED